MPAAAGLGERTEQAIFTQTETVRAGGAKSPASVKETDDSKFAKLFNGLVTVEEGEAKERSQKSRVVNAELWSELMLLYPELPPLVTAEEQIAEGEAEAEAELLVAVENGGDHSPPLTDLALEAIVPTQGDLAETLEAMAEAPVEATLEGNVVDEPGFEGHQLSVDATEHKEVKEETEPQPTALFEANSPETPAHSAQSTGEAEVLQEGVDHFPSQRNGFVVKEPVEIPVGEHTNPQPQPGLVATEGKGSEPIKNRATAEPEVTADKIITTAVGIDTKSVATTETKENVEAFARPETAKPVGTVEGTGIVEILAGADTMEVEIRPTAAITGDSRAAVDAIRNEIPGEAGDVETGETVRQRVFPEAEGDRDAFPAPPATVEREPKNEFKVETSAAKESRFNGELLGQNFSPVVNETPTQGQKIEGTTAPSEPFTPEIAQKDLANQIVSGARLMVKDGVTKIQIQLEPAELGKLELSLVVERDLVAARFVTETQGVQSLIETNLPELRSALEEAGLQVDLLQVGVQTGTDSQMPNQNMTGGEQFKRNTGWQPTAEMFVVEEPIFGEEVWHGMVNLRI